MLKKLYFLPKMLKLHNPPVPPSPFIKKGEGDCVFEIFEKIEGSDFSHRQGYFFFKKKELGGYHYFHTNQPLPVLSFFLVFLVCVFVCFVYLHIIQCNKGSCYEQITGHLNINLYGCVSLLAPECAVHVLCVISNPSTSEKPHCVRPQ